MSRVHIHSSFIHIVNIVYISQHFPIYQWYNMIILDRSLWCYLLFPVHLDNDNTLDWVEVD